MEWTKDYIAQTPSGWGGGNASADPPPNPNGAEVAGVGSVTCSGMITASIPWNGSDPLPKCVIVKETATATWSGSGGTGKDGLGGTATDSSEEGMPPGGSCTTVKYSAVPVTQSPVEVKNAPTATGSLPSVIPGAMSAYASVSYKVEVFPVSIDITGTTSSGSALFVLTGQQLTAKLSAGFPIQGNANPTWSFSEGSDKCFGDFVISDTIDTTKSPPVTTTQGKSEVKNVNFAVKDLLFYTKRDGTVKVAATATVQFPDSTTGTVNAESKPVQSKRPIVDHWNILTGYVGWASGPGGVGASSVLSGDDLILRGYSADDTGGTARRGQDWKALVSVPAPFTGQTMFTGGNMAWAQIVKAERHSFFNSAPTDRPFERNGVEGLDAAFPYANHTFLVEVEGESGDSPYQKKQGYKVTAADLFQTWLMFRPNPVSTNQQTVYIPLEKYEWSWSGTAQVTGVSPNVEEIWQIISASGPGPTMKSNTYDFPIWTAKVVAR